MMKMKFPHRRQFLHLAAGAAALPAVTRIARAQAYPMRPVRIIVGFPAGRSEEHTAALRLFPHRRQFLHLPAGAAALPAVPRIARAQAYPMRPVRIIVGFPAGGGSAIVARLIGQALSERLGQPFVIENRAGAGSNIAAEAVVNAARDGY